MCRDSCNVLSSRTYIGGDISVLEIDHLPLSVSQPTSEVTNMPNDPQEKDCATHIQIHVEQDENVKDHGVNRLHIAQHMSAEEFAAAEKSLKRKLDLRLTAMVWLIFVLNYLDRVSLRCFL